MKHDETQKTFETIKCTDIEIITSQWIIVQNFYFSISHPDFQYSIFSLKISQK